MSQVWPIADAARFAGMTVSMVNYVNRTRILQPLLPAGHARRHGRARGYSFADVVLLRLVRHMTLQGISVVRLTRELQSLREQEDLLTPDKLMRKRFFLTTGGCARITSSSELSAAIGALGPQVLVIDLAAVRAEVAAAIEQPRPRHLRLEPHRGMHQQRPRRRTMPAPA